MEIEVDVQNTELARLVRKHVAAFLWECREKKGCSIRTLSRELKISQELIKHWEVGISCPPGVMMSALLKYYGAEAREKFVELELKIQQLRNQSNS